MTRIGYFFEHPTVSGAEGSALELLAHLDRTAFTPVVFAPAEGVLAGRLAALGLPPRPWRQPRSPGEEAALCDALARENITVLHANSLHLARMTGRLRRACGIPATAHIRDFGTLSARMRADLADNAALVAVSHAVRDALVRQGLPAEAIRVVYNGVSAPPPPSDIRRKLGLPPATPLVAWLGQITVRKGPDVFLEAIGRLAPRAGDVHFLLLGAVFGDKAENRALEALIGTRAAVPPLRGRLHLLGWRDDARAILGACDAVMHTARQEPLSRVLLEALAAGIPIVATDVGGTREAVDDAAELVAPGDAQALAEAAARLLADEGLRVRRRQQGIARWKALFRPEPMTAAVSDLWRSLLGIRG